MNTLMISIFEIMNFIQFFFQCFPLRSLLSFFFYYCILMFVVRVKLTKIHNGQPNIEFQNLF